MTVGEASPMNLVVRALSVLSCLGPERAGLTLQQLHVALDIPLGSLHRLLGTLEQTKFVSRSDRTKRYTLGPAARRLGGEKGPVEMAAAPTPVSRAARQSKETVFITRIVDERVVCTSLVESTHHLRLFVHPGQEMPLHAAASARVILAHRDPAFVERLISESPRDAYTGLTVREVNRIIDHLGVVRRQGYDVCDSELDPDVWAVAAPILEADGRIESGVTLAAAAGRMKSPHRRADMTLVVLRAARELSAGQGFAGEWPGLPSREELELRYASEPMARAYPRESSGRAS